jgi:hypothetical protein
MDEAQKRSNSECYTASSEPFRFHFFQPEFTAVSRRTHSNQPVVNYELDGTWMELVVYFKKDWKSLRGAEESRETYQVGFRLRFELGDSRMQVSQDRAARVQLHTQTHRDSGNLVSPGSQVTVELLPWIR